MNISEIMLAHSGVTRLTILGIIATDLKHFLVLTTPSDYSFFNYYIFPPGSDSHMQLGCKCFETPYGYGGLLVFNEQGYTLHLPPR